MVRAIGPSGPDRVSGSVQRGDEGAVVLPSTQRREFSPGRQVLRSARRNETTGSVRCDQAPSGGSGGDSTPVRASPRMNSAARTRIQIFLSFTDESKSTCCACRPLQRLTGKLIWFSSAVVLPANVATVSVFKV